MAAKKQNEPITAEITGYILTRRRGDSKINELIVALGEEGGVKGLELVEEGSGERLFIPEDVIERVMDRMKVLQEQLRQPVKGAS